MLLQFSLTCLERQQFALDRHGRHAILDRVHQLFQSALYAA